MPPPERHTSSDPISTHTKTACTLTSTPVRCRRCPRPPRGERAAAAAPAVPRCRCLEWSARAAAARPAQHQLLPRCCCRLPLQQKSKRRARPAAASWVAPRRRCKACRTAGGRRCPAGAPVVEGEGLRAAQQLAAHTSWAAARLASQAKPSLPFTVRCCCSSAAPHLALPVDARGRVQYGRQVGVRQFVQPALHQHKLLEAARQARHHAHALRSGGGGRSGGGQAGEAHERSVVGVCVGTQIRARLSRWPGGQAGEQGAERLSLTLSTASADTSATSSPGHSRHSSSAQQTPATPPPTTTYRMGGRQAAGHGEGASVCSSRQAAAASRRGVGVEGVHRSRSIWHVQIAGPRHTALTVDGCKCGCERRRKRASSAGLGGRPGLQSVEVQQPGIDAGGRNASGERVHAAPAADAPFFKPSQRRWRPF